LHSKSNHQWNEKTTYRLGDNICKWWDWQGVNIQNIQTVHTTQYQKTQTTQSNMGRRTKQTFHQRRHTDGQQGHEKILNIVHLGKHKSKP